VRGIRDNVGNALGRKKSSKAMSWDCKNDFLKRSIFCLIRLFIIFDMRKVLVR
jgi:preprotein translocase subunit SecG